jgi:Gly-Xaa carboxypeptidase
MLNFTLIALVGGFGDVGGSIIAIVGTAEKGYTDTRVKVSTAGGHSSVPPAHTVRCNFFPMYRI